MRHLKQFLKFLGVFFLPGQRLGTVMMYTMINASQRKVFVKGFGDVTYCCLCFQITTPLVANKISASVFL